MQDKRDPQQIGIALAEFRKMYPDKPFHELADLTERYIFDSTQQVENAKVERELNAKRHGRNGNSATS